MTFEQFQSEVTGRIKDFLPSEYANADIRIMETHKLNQSYPALIVRLEEEGAAPSIDLAHFYEMSENGYSMEAVLTAVSEQAQQRADGFDLGIFSDYRQIKDKLFIRISDADVNHAVLQNVPHRNISGIAVTCHVMVEIQDGNVGSAMVNNGMLKSLGVSFDELYHDAMENSPRILPPSIQSMEDMLGRMIGFGPGKEIPQDLESQLDAIDFENDPMVVLTNREGVNGAAAILYPDVLHRIGERAETNFFVLPSSVHEVILVADNGHMKLPELSAMVKEINSTQVAPKDRLSDTVYHYDRKERLLEKGSDYEVRISAKETKARAHKEKDWER
ncbi:MAG: hypothetical protein IJ106_04405 [Parasporobacterium sp.]|nr:hypothetical protein [Parasporobacterium sp.]